MIRTISSSRGLRRGAWALLGWVTAVGTSAAQQPIRYVGEPLPAISSSTDAKLPTAKAPPATAVPVAPAACAPAPGCDSPWAKIPDLAPAPRLGSFLLPPTGPGYYTALDRFRGNCQEQAPVSPYGSILTGTNFNNDFRYLDKPGSEPVDFLDNLKRMHLGDPSCPGGWMLSIGGEFRSRYANEIGGANGRLNGRDNRYDLIRNRVYADLWYEDRFRVYVEYLDAQSFGQDLPLLPIDRDRSDILNAFVDIKLGELQEHPVYARLGRQELLYGSQRLISPLDWANTRRTFEGAKVFWHSEDLDVDAFWVRPVLTYPGRFDSADANRQFAGLFSTYRPAKGQAVDAYWLYLDSDLPVVAGRVAGGRLGYNLNTVGLRYSGDHKVSELLEGCGHAQNACDSLLWDVEGAFQFGDYSARNVVAGMTSTGLGYAFNGLSMQPQVWAYYDYASGTPNLAGTGTYETFNQLFPFGHYYFGFLDEVGRENIHDLNFQASIYPDKWVTCVAQYHMFRLDQARDALYGTPPGYPINRRSVTGAAGTDVGNELDLVVSLQLDRHSTLQVGYSKLFAGDFIKQTGVNTNPELFYVQYYFRW